VNNVNKNPQKLLDELVSVGEDLELVGGFTGIEFEPLGVVVERLGVVGYELSGLGLYLGTVTGTGTIIGTGAIARFSGNG
jgi:hypothetical protein